SICFLCLEFSKVIGKTVDRAKNHRNSALSRTNEMRLSWISFEISQSTISEIAMLVFSRSSCSRSVRLPARPAITILVSRFSIPFNSGRHYVAMYFYLALHRADPLRAVLADRNNSGYRLPSLFDDDPFSVELIEYLKTLCLEFRCAD